jgi:hypothetical protein
MSYSNVSIQFVSNNQANVSYVLSTSDLNDAQTQVQNSVKYGGVWVPFTNATSTYYQFFPNSAILSLTVG